MTVLSKEKIEEFKDFGHGKHLIIRGINHYGEEFETAGRIALNDKNELAVYPEMIFLEFGKTRSNGKNYTDYIAPFLVKFPTDASNGAFLLAFEIMDENGKILFEAENTNKIRKLCEQRKKQHDRIMKEEGRYIYQDDEVTAKLRGMIGKPFFIDKQSDAGVLLSIDGLNKIGGVIVEMAKATVFGSNFVYQNSKLFTENNEGERIELARNTPERDGKIFAERYKKIADKDISRGRY